MVPEETPAKPVRRGSYCSPHHRQESFCCRPQECLCRTTAKRAVAAPQARSLLHHRQEGFRRTSGEMVLLPHNGKTIFVSFQIRVFLLLTITKAQKRRPTIGNVNLQILLKIEIGLVSSENGSFYLASSF